VNEIQPGQAASFWHFSLRLYSRPEVAVACLALQSKCDADVNLVLYVLWLAAHNRRVTCEDMRHAVLHTNDWQQSVVSVLRSLRKRLKSLSSQSGEEQFRTLRDYVRHAELEAERLEQLGLEARVNQSTMMFAENVTATAKDNLRIYEALLLQPFPAEESDALVEALAKEAASAK
jgi:uncharacterized protein (TIGR02444 family)